MKKIIFIFLVLFFVNGVFSQDSLKENKHTFLLNATQIYINEYNINYKYNLSEKYNLIVEFGFKFKGNDTLYYPHSFLQFIPFSAATTSGNIDTRINFALMAERKHRWINVSYGIYYRYREINKIYFDNFAGTNSDSWGTYRSETAHLLGGVFQLSKEISIKLKNSSRIIIEPYFRQLILLPLKVKGTQYGYLDTNTWIYTEPTEVSNKCKGIGPFVILGINIGYSF